MGGKKTRDGLSIEGVVSAACRLAGVTVRSGTRHDYVLRAPHMRPCPVDTSTDAKRMVVPWIRQYLGGTYDSKQVYGALQSGAW